MHALYSQRDEQMTHLLRPEGVLQLFPSDAFAVFLYLLPWTSIIVNSEALRLSRNTMRILGIPNGLHHTKVELQDEFYRGTSKQGDVLGVMTQYSSSIDQ